MTRSRRGASAPHALFAVVALAACLGAAAAAAAHGHLDARRIEAELARAQQQDAAASALLLVLSEGEAALRGVLAFGAEGHVAPLQAAVDALSAPASAATAAMVDRAATEAGQPPVSALVADLQQRRRQALAVLMNEGAERLRAVVHAGDDHGRSEEVAELLRRFIARLDAHRVALRDRLDIAQAVSLALVLVSIGLTLVALLTSWLLTRWRTATEKAAQEALARRSGEVGSLLRMSELLQACHDPADVERVVAHAAGEVLPGVPGAFYAFSESRERLDLMVEWGGGLQGAAYFAPGACWSLKRGRGHLCAAVGLACGHAEGAAAALCVPMAAGGEVHGVLQFAATPMAERPAAQELAAALADAVSLALANLALREKLRAQALRDPLTGLHNRRYLEEVGVKLAQQARRRESPFAVAMVDIDHFKKLNDTHGHATGDAVLREVAKVLPSALRRTDIICRYGGEEFIVLLPDSGLDHARERMEEVRLAVAAIGDGRVGELPRVSVSIGVAAVPDCTATLPQAIRLADEALYAAKAGGRDRVEVAARPRPDEGVPLRVVEALAQ